MKLISVLSILNLKFFSHSEEDYTEWQSKEYNYYDYELKREDNKTGKIHGGESVVIQNIESDKYMTIVAKIQTFIKLGSGEFCENNAGAIIDYIKIVKLKYKANHKYMCIPCKWNGAGVPVDYCFKDIGEVSELNV